MRRAVTHVEIRRAEPVSDHLPLTALRAFEAAARLSSFRLAAEELHVTPAAISQQVKALEDLLDTRLFHRKNRGLALTEAGRAGLPALREGFHELAEGMRRMREADASASLKVWTAPSFAAKWLMPRLGGFVERHPGIELSVHASAEFTDSSTSRVELTVERMQTDDIDVAIRFGRGHYPYCRVERLMNAAVSPLCSPALANDPERPLAEPADLAHHTLLHDDTPYEGRPDWAGWFDAAGVEGVDPRRGLRFNSVLLALAAAVGGRGVALSIEQLAEDDIANGRLVRPFSQTLALDSAYYVISRTDAEDDPKVVAFREWLLEEAGEAARAVPGA